jgi:hypothetical protein
MTAALKKLQTEYGYVYEAGEVDTAIAQLSERNRELVGALLDATHRVRYLLQFVEGMDEEATREELKRWEAALRSCGGADAKWPDSRAMCIAAEWLDACDGKPVEVRQCSEVAEWLRSCGGE